MCSSAWAVSFLTKGENMKPIELPVAELKPAITGFGKVVGKRSTLPVLETVRIERNKEGWVTLTGTNLDTFITLRLEQPAQGEPMVLLVPLNELGSILKGCKNEETIFITQPDKKSITLKYPIGQQHAEKSIEALSPGDFPPIPKIEGSAVALSNDIRDTLLQAFECASTDPTRQIINSACIDVSQKNCHQIIGTDGRHLYASNSFSLALRESIVVPANKFLCWKEFGKDGEWKLQVQQAEKNNAGQIQISSRRWQFITRQIEGNYPNWRHAVPKKFKSTVEIAPDQTENVIALIKRLPCAANDEYNKLGLRIGNNKIVLCGQASSTDDKWTEVEVACVKTTGPQLTIHFNREFMTKALTFGLNKIEIQDGLSAFRFINNGRQMVVMPDASPARVHSPRQAPPVEEKASQTHGNGEAETVNSEPQSVDTTQKVSQTPTERSSMQRTATKNGNGHHNGNGDKPALEQALEKIETIKGSYREAIHGLNELAEILKQAQREQKNASREVQTVRSTLEKLQSVRI
jgi:DNA polymerase III sliding clamp (beta) subunit (PCNA family)